jgi:hypothetical protein
MGPMICVGGYSCLPLAWLCTFLKSFWFRL